MSVTPFPPAGLADQVFQAERRAAELAGEGSLIVDPLAPLALNTFDRFGCRRCSGRRILSYGHG